MSPFQPSTKQRKQPIPQTLVSRKSLLIPRSRLPSGPPCRFEQSEPQLSVSKATTTIGGRGFVGPTFGPLSCYVHTYCCTLRIHAANGTVELWLAKCDDMIRWDRCLYGDMELFIAGTSDKA